MRREKPILYRFFFLMLALMITGLTGCQATDDSSSSNAGTSPNEQAASPAAKTVTTTATAPASDAPPVASAHGSVGQTNAAAPPPPAANANANNSADKPEIDTPKLDAKIAKAEAKAKAMGASDAERRAAAEAYFERGYVYYSAQNPRLYKFALGDFRRVVQYQPAHKEARDIIAQIEGIYRSMGRPVPTNGLEP
jgi:predicted lipid-binding transport protein (Tim44 family)